jgi:hypothetical protein
MFEVLIDKLLEKPDVKQNAEIPRVRSADIPLKSGSSSIGTSRPNPYPPSSVSR